MKIGLLKFWIPTFQASKYNNEASVRDIVNDQQEWRIPRRERMIVFNCMNSLDTIWKDAGLYVYEFSGHNLKYDYKWAPL